MKKFLTGTLVLFLCFAPTILMATPESAADAAQNVCQSFKAGVVSLKAQAPEAVVVELTAAQRAAVVARYNATEPATDYKFDHVYTIGPPGGLNLMVVFVIGDCVIDIGQVPAAALAKLIGQDT